MDEFELLYVNLLIEHLILVNEHSFADKNELLLLRVSSFLPA